jgi:hypothetical protein
LACLPSRRYHQRRPPRNNERTADLIARQLSIGRVDAEVLPGDKGRQTAGLGEADERRDIEGGVDQPVAQAARMSVGPRVVSSVSVGFRPPRFIAC